MRALGARDWQVDDRALAWVDVDQQRLTQAVLQLAANAVRHTEEGAVVAIGSRLVGQTALSWVRDTGDGIDIEQQARIFERFRRGTAEGEGSGLGLAIVRGIAQAHGGEVRLESAPGEGATFTIVVPGAGRVPEEPPMSRILIVEDEPRISAFIEKGLRAEGYTPTVAADGITALDYALQWSVRSGDPRRRPARHGRVRGAARGCGSRVATIPVIVLTARDSVTDTVRGLEGGADDYMPKPFRFAELVARVKLRLRTATRSGRIDEPTVVEVGGVSLDLVRREVRVDGKLVELSAREFVLAETFLRHPGQVLSREQLLSHVWGYEFDPGSNVVDVYVGYLRKKLGADRIIDGPRDGLPLPDLTVDVLADLEARQPRLGQRGHHRLDELGQLDRAWAAGSGSAWRQARIGLATAAGTERGSSYGGHRELRPPQLRRRVAVVGFRESNGRYPAAAWNSVAPMPHMSAAGPGGPCGDLDGSHCSGAM